MVDEGFPAVEISGRLAADDLTVVWLDLLDPDMSDLGVVIEEFGLHPLAVEDAIVDHQRPKLDRYQSHLFLNLYATSFEKGSLEVRVAEISAFVTPRALVTVRKADFDVDALVARWDTSSAPRASVVGFLLHGLLDAVVDGQYESAQHADDAVDELEECLFEQRRDIDIRRQGYDLRKSLVQLRRVILPMRDALRQLLRSEIQPLPEPVLAEELLPYYQDVFDHVLSAAEGVEAARDMIAGILDTSLNEQSFALNDITKKLASWAAIIAVPTAVTGFYGQNVPYPGFGKEAGFITSLVVMFGLAVGLYILLRKRGWL